MNKRIDLGHRYPGETEAERDFRLRADINLFIEESLIMQRLPLLASERAARTAAFAVAYRAMEAAFCAMLEADRAYWRAYGAMIEVRGRMFNVPSDRAKRQTIFDELEADYAAAIEDGIVLTQDQKESE